MKKLGKFLIAGALAAVACVGLVACGDETGETNDYKGEYQYENTWTPGSYYGAKVTVTIQDVIGTVKMPVSEKETIKIKDCIKDGKIVKVTVEADTDTVHNVTPTWTEGANAGDLGHDKTVAALEDYLKKFEGKKVSKLMESLYNEETFTCNVKVSATGEPLVDADSKAGWSDYVLTGATQTSGRITLAVLDSIMDWSMYASEFNQAKYLEQIAK